MQRRTFIVALIVCGCTLSACHGQDYKAEAERLAPLLHWRPGSVVADIGAGAGEMTLEAAKRVGPTGRVYATEIDDAKLARLEKLAAEGKNIVAVKAASEETNLPAACCDSIILRRVYHHFPAPAEMAASLLQTLKPGGMLAVVDFEPRWSFSSVKEHVPENRGGHGVPKKYVIQELTAAGFELVAQPEGWRGNDYCLIFRKPNSPQTSP